MIDFRMVKPGMLVQVEELDKLKRVPCVVPSMYKQAGKVVHVLVVNDTSIRIREDPCWFWSDNCFSSIVSLEAPISRESFQLLLKGAVRD